MMSEYQRQFELPRMIAGLKADLARIDRGETWDVKPVPIHQILHEKRLALKIGMKVVQRKLGIGHTALWNYERGLRKPDEDTMQKWMAALS